MNNLNTQQLIQVIHEDRQFFRELKNDLDKREFNTSKEKEIPMSSYIALQSKDGHLRKLKSVGISEDASSERVSQVSKTGYVAKTMSWIRDKTSLNTGYLTGKSATEFCLQRLRDQSDEIDLRSRSLLRDLNENLEYWDLTEASCLLHLLDQACQQIQQEIFVLEPLIQNDIFKNKPALEKAQDLGKDTLAKLKQIRERIQEGLEKTTKSPDYYVMKAKIFSGLSEELERDLDWTSGDLAEDKENRMAYLQKAIHYYTLTGLELTIQGLEPCSEVDRILAVKQKDKIKKEEEIWKRFNERLEEQLEEIQEQLEVPITEEITEEDIARLNAVSSQIEKIKKMQEEIGYSKHLFERFARNFSVEIIPGIESEGIREFRNKSKDLSIISYNLDETLKKAVDQAAKKYHPILEKILKKESELAELEKNGMKTRQQLVLDIESLEPPFTSSKAHQEQIEDLLNTIRDLNSMNEAIPLSSSPSMLSSLIWGEKPLLESILSKEQESFLILLTSLVRLHFVDKDASERIALESSISKNPQWEEQEKQLKSLIAKKLSNIEDQLRKLKEGSFRKKLNMPEVVIDKGLAQLKNQQKLLQQMVVKDKLDIFEVSKNLFFLKSPDFMNQLHKTIERVHDNESDIAKDKFERFEKVFMMTLGNCFYRQKEVDENFSSGKTGIEAFLQMEHRKFQLSHLEEELSSTPKQRYYLDQAKHTTQCLSRMQKLVA